jgi:hypothetical protein
MEMESAAADPGWTHETGLTGFTGFTGTAYKTFTGANAYSTTSLDAGTIREFTFYLPDDGTYDLRFRTYKGVDGSATDAANDGWVSIDGTHPLSGIVDPATGMPYAPPDLGHGNATWIKVFNGGTSNAWVFHGQWDYNPSRPLAWTRLTKRIHSIRIAGRSNGFRLDRLHVYRRGTTNPVDKTRPESPKGATVDGEDAAAPASAAPAAAHRPDPSPAAGHDPDASPASHDPDASAAAGDDPSPARGEADACRGHVTGRRPR